MSVHTFDHIMHVSSTRAGDVEKLEGERRAACPFVPVLHASKGDPTPVGRAHRTRNGP